MKKAWVKLRVEEKSANLLERALAPEVGREVSRSKARIEGEDGVMLCIEAEDTSALRAALNSYLRWIHEALEIERMVIEWNCHKKYKTN